MRHAEMDPVRSPFRLPETYPEEPGQFLRFRAACLDGLPRSYPGENLGIAASARRVRSPRAAEAPFETARWPDTPAAPSLSAAPAPSRARRSARRADRPP